MAVATCLCAAPARAQINVGPIGGTKEGTVCVRPDGTLDTSVPGGNCGSFTGSVLSITSGSGTTQTVLDNDGNLTLGHDTQVNGDLTIHGGTAFDTSPQFNQGATFVGAATFNGGLTSSGITNNGDLSVTGATTLTGSLTAADISASSISVTGSANSASIKTGSVNATSLFSSGGAQVQGFLTVNGGASLNGTTQISNAQVGNLSVLAGGTIDAGGNRIQNVGTPIAATDAANKAYVDAVAGNTTALGQDVAAALGGGSTYDPATGQLSAPSYQIGSTTYDSVGAALNAANTSGLGYFHTNSTGPDSSATGADSTAIGPGSAASGDGSFAAGDGALASANGATAIGEGAHATGTNAIAIGTNALATGSVAVGFNAIGSNGGAAFGDNSKATGLNATAVGPTASANAAQSTAFGFNANAAAANATATGATANASGANSSAFGFAAAATGANATAIGNGASATFANSTAIGNGASATAANQVTIGGAGSAVRLGGYTSAGVLVNDADGNVTTDTALLPQVAANTANIATNTANIAANTASIAALQNGQAALSGRLDNLFAQTNIDRRDARQGIAAAVALSPAPMPSAPGRTSYTLNGSTFRGQYAVGASIMHRFDGERPFALTAGFSFAGNRNNAARIGVAGEF
ncbi:MAG TPA: hypothetical protein VGF77_14720 [Allosphingosinicella sp.]